MKGTVAAILVLAAVLPANLGWSVAAQPDAGDYSVIYIKQPFGPPPPKPPVAANIAKPPAPPPPDPRLFDSLKVCFIRRSDAGELRCGIVDAKMNKSAVLCVGDSDSELGIALVNADFAEGGALIRKSSVEKWLYLDGTRSASSGNPSAVIPASSPSVAGEVHASRIIGRPGRGALRYRKVEPPPVTGEELENLLKEQQMDAIRNGAPPLPIPLTREMDETLVQEGHLPPLE